MHLRWNYRPHVSSDDFDISVDGITEETLDDPFAGVDFGEAQSTQDAVTEEPAVEESAETTETSEDDFSLDDLSLDDIDTSIDIPEESSVEDTVIEEPAVEETVSEPAVETTEEAVSSFQLHDRRLHWMRNCPRRNRSKVCKIRKHIVSGLFCRNYK